MNDYFLREWARQRQADYLHELERDQRVSALRASKVEAAQEAGPADDPAPATIRHAWQHVLGRLAPRRMIVHGNRR